MIEGELTLCGEREGSVVPTAVLGAGDSVWVPPWTFHGTLNLWASPTRFEVVGLPGAMSGYFAEAGVQVPDDQTPPATNPPGPAVLGASHDGESTFWIGPVDRTSEAALPT